MRIAVLVLVAVVAVVSADSAQRPAHSTKERCRYVKGTWSACEPAPGATSGSGLRSRTLTLKKGDPATCEPTKTIQKKCKKACRYDKSPWSPCTAAGEMRRVDSLRAGSDSGCDPRRTLTRKCTHHARTDRDRHHGGRNGQ